MSAVWNETGGAMLVEVFCDGSGWDGLSILCEQSKSICPSVQVRHGDDMDSYR